MLTPPRLPTQRVDLGLSPEDRWAWLADCAEPARALLAAYLADLGTGAAQAKALIAELAPTVLSKEEASELRGVAQAIGASPEDVLVANLYYDLVKASLGCSTFALDTPEGPLHGRNLDWWTVDDLLRRETMVTEFVRGERTVYRTVGWPGFIGCFSGVAPGRFALTLNAVLSDEPFQVATPVVFLLRRVLESARDFHEAVGRLRDEPVASDCLLLVSGVRPGELAVVERTPRRGVVRGPDGGFIEVTNDYRALTSGEAGVDVLASTSCGRSERLRALLSAGVVRTLDDVWPVLADPKVKMGITVQHMAFRARTGACEVRLPSP